MKTFTLDGWVCRGQNGAPGVETRTTQGGRCVTKWRMNCPDRTREGVKTPAYFGLEYWHDPGDRKAALVQDGACLLVSGRLAYEEWTDKATGQKRSEVRLKADEIGLIFPPGQAPQPAPQGYAQQPYQPQPPYAPQGGAQQPYGYGYAPQPPQAAYAAPAPQAQAAAYAPPAQYAAPAQAQAASVYDDEIPF